MPLVEDPADALLYGVDLRMTDDGDLALSNGGDLVQAIGTVNAAQAVVLRLRTPTNSLPMHPDYGSDLLSRLIGSKAHDAELVAAHVITTGRRMSEQDRRFTGITDLVVDTDTTTVRIGCSIALSGGEKLKSADLGSARVDELAIDASDLTDLIALGDISDLGLGDLVAGIPADDPDYGDVPDFAQLLDEADTTDALEDEGP